MGKYQSAMPIEVEDVDGGFVCRKSAFETWEFVDRAVMPKEGSWLI